MTILVGVGVSMVYTKVRGVSVLVEDKYLASFLRKSEVKTAIRDPNSTQEKECYV